MVIFEELPRLAYSVSETANHKKRFSVLEVVVGEDDVKRKR